MTTEERIAALEIAIKAVPKRGRWLAQAERDLVKHALCFAYLKLHRMILNDDGTRALLCTTDAEEHASYVLKQMQSDALAMVRELSIEEVPK